MPPSEFFSEFPFNAKVIMLYFFERLIWRLDGCISGTINNYVSPVVSQVYSNCSSVGMIWELPPVEVVCAGKLYYVLEIKSSEAGRAYKEKIQIELSAFGLSLERNKSYSIHITAFDLNGKPVESPWQQNFTVIPSAVPDPPEITNVILDLDSSIATIYWKNFDDHGCNIFYNNIYSRIVNEGNNSERWSRRRFQPYYMQRVQWYQLQVQLDRMYEVIVTAENSEGESSKELVIPTIIGNITKEPEILVLLLSAIMTELNIPQRKRGRSDSASKPNWSKCLCHVRNDNRKLCFFSEKTWRTFEFCANQRQDEVLRVMEGCWSEEPKGGYHKKCYQAYTNKAHVARAARKKPAADEKVIDEPVKKRVCRSSISVTNPEKCAICQKDKFQRSRGSKTRETLCQGISEQAITSLRKAARIRSDDRMLIAIQARNIKYHRSC
ncbi:hypothetical protein ACROYT_G040993 [Oculina patagonica]